MLKVTLSAVHVTNNDRETILYCQQTKSKINNKSQSLIQREGAGYMSACIKNYKGINNF